MIHILAIPNYHPPRLNQVRGRHWFREHAAKRDLAALLKFEAHNQHVPPATGKRRVRLQITGWIRGGKLPDLDAYDKLLLDALVRARLLQDDDGQDLDGRLAVELCRGEKRTVITLEDVP